MDSKAITKIQAIILTAIIIVAAVVAGVVYISFYAEPAQQDQTIKIGVCTDLDSTMGPDLWRGAVLAAEQVNAEGGVLGRNFEIVGEDNDEGTMPLDPTKTSAAMTKLITFHKVDYVIGGLYDEATIVMQDIAAEHKKIFLSCGASAVLLTQRVIDNYDKYKYYFRTSQNATAVSESVLESIVTLREYSGFNKIAYLAEDSEWTEQLKTDVDNILAEEYGFDVVYRGVFSPGTVDFTSYFAAAEAAGAEVLIPLMSGMEGISFTKEHYDRQSPLVVWGLNWIAAMSEYWIITEGKCEHETSVGDVISAGYPMSNKTLPMQDAFIDRWENPPDIFAIIAYDIVRFILPDAIERAGTTETDAVIEALEETDIEIASSPRLAFTASHDTLVAPGYTQTILLQWQNGKQVPIYPKKIMEEVGATYTYPDWPGPWD